MSADVLWTPAAQADLREIYALIGLEQPRVAERYLDRILKKAEMLAAQPRLGARRPEIRADARMLVERPYVILYRTRPDADEGAIETVEIVRVIDGRRDLIALF